MLPAAVSPCELTVRPEPDRSALPGAILGTGAFVPERIVPNRYFVDELKLDTTTEWIGRKTGIQERRFASAGTTVADMAAGAARQALEQGSIDPRELTLIVVATSTADYRMPSTAALVQQQLGANGAAAFDISAACAGFVYAMDVAARCLASTGGTALVIGADRATSLVDPLDRSTSIFFGDGAGAILLATNGPGRVLASELRAHGRLEALAVPSGGWMRMDGRAIWEFATRVLPETLLSLCQSAGIGVEDLKLVVPHQANVNIIRAAADDLGLGIERFAINIERVGNTVAASIPLALDEALRNGRARAGDLVALVGFGAGLCWGGQLLQL